MKYRNKILNTIYAIGGLLIMLSACKKQNTPETIAAKQIFKPTSQEYFANLRAYKKSNHQVFFGWWGNSGGAGDSKAVSATLRGGIEAIPDSVDIVSLWGGYPVAGSPQDIALRNAQKIKGTRFVMCLFGSRVDTLRMRNFPKLPILDGIDSVAKAIADTISKHQLDGFDLDYEPGFGDGGIFGHGGGGSDAGGDIYTQRLFKAFSKYLGPKSGTGKLLIIDGQSEAGIADYIDYLAQQAYGTGSPAGLEQRFQQYGFGTLPIEKFIPTENFEDFWDAGGTNYTDPVYGTIPSLLGMAYWRPANGGRKGGAGAYHAEYDYGNSPDYQYIRQAIQIMNPAVK